MGIFMGTTKIPATKTAGEIQALLAAFGARAVAIDYDDDGEACAIAFRIIRQNVPLQFKLPVRWRGVLRTLGRGRAKSANEDQAKRTAWRQVKRWVEAQLALVETETADVTEVFLPYLQVDAKGTTFYEAAIESGKVPQLPAPKE